MSNTQQRVAIVTGGSRGIGREIVTRLAAEGYSVIVNYAGNKAAADSAVAQLQADGAEAIAIRADVADEKAVARMFDVTEQQFGGIDVVVHAAGTVLRSPLADLDLSALDAVLRTNLRGTFVVDQQAVRRLRRGGALINLTTSAIRFSTPGNSAYVASKGGVEAITLTLARELRDRDVTVNAVAPGSIETEMLEQYLDGDEQLRAQIAARSPLNRLGTPTDIADIVLFLAGPGRWVNGQVIFANGGAI
jgi:3-oxoacyl-[acyl-carrier protein] reductase